MSSNQDYLELEVAYATPEKQLIISLQVPKGLSVSEVIELSEIRLSFPEIEANPTVGIFSHKVPLDYQPSTGERIEIYRPLIADPKEIRRQKAELEREEIKKRRKPARTAGR